MYAAHSGIAVHRCGLSDILWSASLSD